MAVKRLLVLAFVACLLAISAASSLAVGEGACEEGAGKLYVVCMTTVLASIVEQVGGPYVDVEAIVPPGFCPGHYDIRPSDVEAVRQADVLIGHIAVFPWMEDLLEAAGRSTEELHMLSGPWNTPYTAISYVKNITAILCEHPETNSTMRDYFVSMNETICSELLALAEGLEAKATSLGTDSIKV
ncbi:hypothetical protein DRO33_03070, partial [Candidatus Bathyarchaeota archaeon]